MLAPPAYATGTFTCAARLGGSTEGLRCARRQPHENGHVYEASFQPDVLGEGAQADEDSATL